MREAKRKLRQPEFDTVPTPGSDHVTKYQGRVGNGNFFNFIIAFTNPSNYYITIADGYHEGYKFESYTLFCNFLKANQYDPSKERVLYTYFCFVFLFFDLMDLFDS